jgi:Leucine-rich repeat (LRR) protein
LTDLKNIENFVNLKWLNLKKNKLTHINGLRHLTNLQWLDLSKNSIVAKNKQDLS